MADVVLYPNEPSPYDIRLQEAGAVEPTTHTVAVIAIAAGNPTVARVAELTRQATATATGTTNIATLLYPSAPIPPAQEPGRGGMFVRPLPPPILRTVHITTKAVGVPVVTVDIDHAGRRREEDELILVGAS